MADIVELRRGDRRSADPRVNAKIAERFRDGLNAAVAPLNIAGTEMLVELLVDQLEVTVDLIRCFDPRAADRCVLRIQAKLHTPDADIPF